MRELVNIVRASILEADEVAEFLGQLESVIISHKQGLNSKSGREDLEQVKVDYIWTGMGPRLIVEGRYHNINCTATPKVAGPVIELLQKELGEEWVKLNLELEISNLYL